MNLQKQTKIKSNKLRASAKGQPCFININKVCNHNPETTVLCHRGGGGMGGKSSDIFGSFGCSSCHDVVDGRVVSDYSPVYIDTCFRDGQDKTQQFWIDNGLLVAK